MNYIDVHCHLDGETYGDLSALVSACADSGVTRLIAVGFDIPSSRFALSCAEKFEGVYFAAGFHPTELSGYKEGDLEEIERLCMHPKCVAVGEIGLDYHYPDTDKKLQREVFLRQLELAEKLHLPVEIHSRDCAADMLEILGENSEKLRYGALMHCYSHSAEVAADFSALGMYFSFGGASTWKGNKKAKRTISALPADRLLSETDSPYMPPASAYGTFPNTPLSIPEIVENMAALRGENLSQTADRIWENAHALFKKLG